MTKIGIRQNPKSQMEFDLAQKFVKDYEKVIIRNISIMSLELSIEDILDIILSVIIVSALNITKAANQPYDTFLEMVKTVMKQAKTNP